MHTKTGIWLEVGFFVFAMCAPASIFAQSQTAPRPQELTARVPFVGCGSDGQVGPVKAPTGKSKVVPITADLANRLAYYKAEMGIGVLAPRGWHCFCTYGSNGSNLYVSPQPIDSKELFSTTWSSFVGPVIEIVSRNGDTSGRFKVAQIIARVFPAHKEFVGKVIEEGIEPASSFPFGPYPADKLVYKTKEVVEYQTPARKDGLGTNSTLKKNETPISGVAILTGETPDLVLLAVRLSPGPTDLTSAIIQQVEHDAEHSGG